MTWPAALYTTVLTWPSGPVVTVGRPGWEASVYCMVVMAPTGLVVEVTSPAASKVELVVPGAGAWP